MIEHLKSGLSISTHMGCGLNCSYCILATMNGFNNGPVLQKEPEILIKELFYNYKYFLENETPLMINNRTDPFLPKVTPYTLKILDLLIEYNITSPIVIISKFAPPYALKKYFKKLDICYFYSYSGLKSDFNYNKVTEDLKIIKKIIPPESRFHYFRPIIPGVNDNVKYIRQILNLFYEHNFYASIISGFRVTNLNRHLIKDKTINVNHIDYNHKLINNDIYNVNQWFKNKRYYIFRHTSCALASHIQRFNKLNYFSKNNHCFTGCPNFNLCKTKKINLNDILIQLNKKFNGEYEFETNNDKIVIVTPCTQELTAFIKNAFGCEVLAKKLKLSKSEEVILSEQK